MLTYDDIFRLLGLCVVGAPTVLFMILGLSSLLPKRPLREQVVSACSHVAILTGLLASIAILVLMLTLNRLQVPISLGDWVMIPNYHFVVKFEFDRLSVPFAILTFTLCGTIGAIAVSESNPDVVWSGGGETDIRGNTGPGISNFDDDLFSLPHGDIDRRAFRRVLDGVVHEVDERTA